MVSNTLTEIPVYSELTYMPGKSINPAVGYVCGCPSLARQDCHGGYHHSSKWVWKVLKQHIREEQARTNTLNSSILIQKPGPGHILSITLGMDILFLSVKLYRQPIKLLTGKGPKSTKPQSHGGCTQIWDGFM